MGELNLTWIRCSRSSAKKNERRNLYKYHLHVYANFFLVDNIDFANNRKYFLSGSPKIRKNSIHIHVHAYKDEEKDEL